MTGFESFGAALLFAVEPLADPLEAPGDGEFVSEFTDLIAEQGEIGESPFEIGLFGLEPFEFDEEELTITFRGGEFSFGFGDLGFEFGEDLGEVGDFAGHFVILALEFGDSCIPFRHLLLGSLGGVFGFLLGLGQFQGDRLELVRDVEELRRA